MIFLVPIVPILIAIVILILAITFQIASGIEIITKVGIILVIATSVLSIILNIFRKNITFGKKISGIIVSIVASILSFFVSKTFFEAIVLVDAGSLMGSIEFIFVIIVGGGMWLGSVGLATYASFNAIYNFSEYGIATSIYCLMGAGILGGILLAIGS